MEPTVLLGDIDEPTNDVTLGMLEELEDAYACMPARRWIIDMNFTSRQEAWNACERPDWMEWWLNTCSISFVISLDIDLDEDTFYLDEDICSKIREVYPTVPERIKDEE